MPQFYRTPYFRLALHAGLCAASALSFGAAFLTGGALLASSRAEAQGLFGWDSPAPKYRKKKRVPSVVSDDALPRAEKGSKKAASTERRADGPLVVNVSLSRQRLTVFDATGPIASSPISSGRVGYGTPTGVFTVVQKRRMHYSNLYDSAPMPNMQRITWSGVALHAGALPGYPASHGCIRLPHGFSKKLFGMTQLGTRVIVTREPVAPISIAHASLFTAFPPDEGLADGGLETQVADASRVTGGTDEALPGALSVSVAAAAGTDDATPSVAPPRLSYRERRRLEAEKLNAEIRTAGYEKAEKMIALTQAQRAAAIARDPLIGARAEADRLATQLSELENSLSDAERELAVLKTPPEETGKRNRKSKKVMDESKRIAKILTLEAKVSRLPSEIEAVRAAWQTADTAFKAAAEVFREADDKRRAAMAEVMKVNSVLSQALAKETAAKKLEAKRNLPVSVFISRAKQRLYIRQGYEDILDVAVTFDRPEDPVGTHVFTALAVAEDKTTMKWSVASVPHDPSRSAKKKKDQQTKGKPAEPMPVVAKASQTPAAALDRITIPDDVREQIADVMKPGSSLVISDLAIGNETGEYTDFIVPIR